MSFGIRDTRPNGKIIKAADEMAKRRGMTLAEYQEKVLNFQKPIDLFELFLNKCCT